jgi:V/A-type H+-transporting ATPase subunit E
MSINQEITKVIDSILNDAKSHAEKELLAIRDEFLKESAQIQEELLKEAETRLTALQTESQLSKDISRLNIELEIKRKSFEMLDSIVTSVIDAVKRKIRDIREEPVYEEALKKYLDQALNYTTSTNVIIEGNAEDKPLLIKIAKAAANEKGINISVSDENIETVGGFIVRSKDGTFTYYSTLEIRLEELKENLRKVILEKLSEE